MNIIRVNKRFFIIDGVPLKLELDTYESCRICYYYGFSCDTEGHVLLCNFLKVLDNDFLNGEFHLQLVKSLILVSKIRNDKYK